eukprot:90328-Amphidinium_carterae.1
MQSGSSVGGFLAMADGAEAMADPLLTPPRAPGAVPPSTLLEAGAGMAESASVQGTDVGGVPPSTKEEDDADDGRAFKVLPGKGAGTGGGTFEKGEFSREEGL